MPRTTPSVTSIPLAVVSFAAALGTVACGEPDASARGAVTRDSAGVAIVESTAPAWRAGRALALAAEPTVRIGEEEGAPEYQFGRVSAATRLSDGRLAVFDGMANELRFYDAAGTYLSRTGGKGGGPGEYQRVTWMRRLDGDSLMLHDASAQRITVLAPDGAVARSANLAAAAATAAVGAREEAGGRAGRVVLGGGGRVHAIAPFGDGTLLARTTPAPRINEPAGGARDTVTYLRLAPDGTVLDTLGRFAADEMQVSSSGSGQNMLIEVGPAPFGRSSQVAVERDGFWFGSADRYELARYDTAGRLVRLLRRPAAPLPVRAEDAEAQKNIEMESRGADASPELRARLRQSAERRWADAKLPATLPAHGPIMSGAGGHLWVRETNRPADRVPRWTVFDPDGAMLGTVTMPEGFRPLEFGDGYVLGVQRDENDVEQLVSYPLVPARP